jgi:alpha-galactosidase
MKRTFFYLFLASCSVAPAQTSDLTSPDLWKAANAPFSFKYAGKDSSQILPGWQASDENATVKGLAGNADHAVHRYIYTDPDTKLIVTAEVRTFPDFPGAVDWVLYFKNGGTADTPFIENILPLHESFPTQPDDCVVRHDKGSSAGGDDFKPLEEHFGPGGNDHQESPGGNPSSDNSLPFFNIQSRDHGYILGLGWTGGWKADFVNAQDGKSIAMSSGMKATHLLLHPGEEIRSPRIVLLPWSGGDWTDAQNNWRRLLFAHYVPHDNGQPMLGPVMSGSWGSEDCDKKIAFVNWIHNHHLPIDLYALDAGWYGDSFGAESDPTNPWWNNRGDWFPSPRYYPNNGMHRLGEACKAADMGLMVWVEPETTMPNKKIVNEHPDWFLKSPNPVNPGVMMANYGDPAALRGITDMVSGFITDFGMTWFRQDFNIPPADYWNAHDTPDRIGMTEIEHVTGMYQFWDELLAKHPGLHIDNCASGGRRFDMETLPRSFIVWRTDNGNGNAMADQAMTQQLAYWVPENMSWDLCAIIGTFHQAAPYNTALNIYLSRLGYDLGYGMNAGETGLENQPWIDFLTTGINEYKETQPYFLADFYAMTPYSTGDDVWTAWQLNRPEKKDGLVILLRRGSSLYSSMDMELHHLDPNATYEVDVRHTYDKEPVKEMKGSDLAKMRVELGRPDSELIFYRQK